MFPFAARRFEYSMYATVVFGFRPVDDASAFNPLDKGTVHRDPGFTFSNVQTLHSLARICNTLVTSNLTAQVGQPFDF